MTAPSQLNIRDDEIYDLAHGSAHATGVERK
jgi:hypothetical protein